MTSRDMVILDFALLLVLGCALVVGASNMPFAYQNQFQRRCSFTGYPTLCVQTLQEFGSVQQSVDVVSLLVNKTIYESELPSSFFAVPQEDRHVQSIADHCKNLMKMSQERLNQAMKAIKRSSRNEHKQDIQTWLSAAMTFQEACKDATYQNTSALSHMSRKMDRLSQLVSNSLSLVNQIQETSKSLAGQTVKGSTVFPGWVSARERRLLQANTVKPNAVVAKDGSGNYETVLEAIDAAASGSGRFVIYVKAGVYKEKIRTGKSGITLIGDGKDQTVIVGDDSVARGASMPDSATFTVTGDGFIARDIGFMNAAGPEGKRALALSIASDRSVLYRCSIAGYQDTLYALALRQFYRECDIFGTIDFIFGNAVAVFQSCNLVLHSPGSGSYNVILANGRTDPGQNTGFSVHNCRIIRGSDFSSAKNNYNSYLGRPWKKYSRSVIMQSYIDDAIAGRGWIEWPGAESGILKTLYFAEYENSGPGAEISKRVSWPGFHVIGANEATQFTVGRFVAGSSWLPSTGVPFILGLQ